MTVLGSLRSRHVDASCSWKCGHGDVNIKDVGGVFSAEAINKCITLGLKTRVIVWTGSGNCCSCCADWISCFENREEFRFVTYMWLSKCKFIHCYLLLFHCLVLASNKTSLKTLSAQVRTIENNCCKYPPSQMSIYHARSWEHHGILLGRVESYSGIAGVPWSRPHIPLQHCDGSGGYDSWTRAPKWRLPLLLQALTT